MKTKNDETKLPIPRDTVISDTEIKKAVREHYAALVINEEESESCCARKDCFIRHLLI